MSGALGFSARLRCSETNSPPRTPAIQCNLRVVCQLGAKRNGWLSAASGRCDLRRGGLKGGNDAQYRGARRSVDQIALPAGLLKVVSLRARRRWETIAV